MSDGAWQIYPGFEIAARSTVDVKILLNALGRNNNLNGDDMKNISDFIDEVSASDYRDISGVSKVIQAKLMKILVGLTQNCEEITGAMVSSYDGLAWAEKLPAGIDPNRFAAMSSAMLALSDTMMHETQNTKTRNVFLEGNDGMMFVMHAGANLLLTIFTQRTQQFGLPLAHAKKAAEEISKLNLNVPG